MDMRFCIWPKAISYSIARENEMQIRDIAPGQCYIACNYTGYPKLGSRDVAFGEETMWHAISWMPKYWFRDLAIGQRRPRYAIPGVSKAGIHDIALTLRNIISDCMGAQSMNARLCNYSCVILRNCTLDVGSIPTPKTASQTDWETNR